MTKSFVILTKIMFLNLIAKHQIGIGQIKNISVKLLLRKLLWLCNGLLKIFCPDSVNCRFNLLSF